MICGCIAGAVGGAIAGGFNAVSWSYNMPGIATIPAYFKSGHMTAFIGFLISIVVSFVLGMVLTMIVGFKEEVDKTEENKVAFTMNCAWNADDIDSILETLKNNEVHITFFMVGEWVDKYPEAVKKIYEAGHEIGSHSNTHPHVNNLTAEKNLEEIKLSVDKIEKITGYKTNLYRAPYGEYNNTVIKTAQQNGFYPIQWNLDTLDYQGLTGEKMWNRLKNKLDGGAIILSHNGTKHTADSLDMLIKNIKASGFQVTTISEIIYKDNYSINNKGTQIKN